MLKREGDKLYRRKMHKLMWVFKQITERCETATSQSPDKLKRVPSATRR